MPRCKDRDTLIGKTGATLIPYGSTRPNDADPSYAAPAGQEYIAGTLLSFLIEAERTLPQLEAALLADRPDLVVFDRMAFAGSVFARKHRLPAVQLWPMMVSGPQWSWVREEDLSHPTMAGYLAYLDLFLAGEGLQIDPASFLAPRGATASGLLPAGLSNAMASFLMTPTVLSGRAWASVPITSGGYRRPTAPTWS